MKYIIHRAAFIVAIATAAQLAGVTAARAQDQSAQTIVVAKQLSETNGDPTARVVSDSTTETVTSDDGGGASVFAVAGVPGQQKIVIQSIEPDGEPSRDMTWLGLSVDESPEVLSSQLGLKPGEGLIVNFIAPDSPAAKVDFQKNDVLTELDGQMLVDAAQLRKLVQMHAEGDTIKLTFYRGGQKQTVSVKLGKRKADAEFRRLTTLSKDGSFGGGSFGGGWSGSAPRAFQFQMGDLDGQMRGLRDSLARAGLDKDKIQIELQRTLEQTSKAIRDSMNQASNGLKSLTNVDRELEALVRNGVDVDKDSTVTVRSKHNSSRTIVKTDDDGTIVYTSGEKEHLVAHDKDGKLLFDGDIGTPEEQAKVPKAVWEKLQETLKQNTFDSGDAK